MNFVRVMMENPVITKDKSVQFPSISLTAHKNSLLKCPYCGSNRANINSIFRHIFSYHPHELAYEMAQHLSRKIFQETNK